MSVGQSMFGVAKFAELVENALRDVSHLVIETEKAELCTFRVVPPFYEHRGERMDNDDIKDLNDINSHLLTKLSGGSDTTGLVFKLVPTERLNRLGISLAGSDLTKENITALQSLVCLLIFYKGCGS